MDEINLFAKAGCFSMLRINLRLQFRDATELNVEPLPNVVELILDDREDVDARHRFVRYPFMVLTAAILDV